MPDIAKAKEKLIDFLLKNPGFNPISLTSLVEPWACSIEDMKAAAILLQEDRFIALRKLNDSGLPISYAKNNEKWFFAHANFEASLLPRGRELAENLESKQSKSQIQTKPREKHQKFGILDAPNLLEGDIRQFSGLFGSAVIFLDLDDFKRLNTMLTETVVDRTILPTVHQLFRGCAEHLGFAYAAGGDEFTFFLPNCTDSIALQFCNQLLREVAARRFEGPAAEVELTASIGFAHDQRNASQSSSLLERANLAKKHAKENGKNCVSQWRDGSCAIVPNASAPVGGGLQAALDRDPEGFYVEKSTGRRICGLCWEKHKRTLTLLKEKRDGPAAAVGNHGYQSWTEYFQCPDCKTIYAREEKSRRF